MDKDTLIILNTVQFVLLLTFISILLTLSSSLADRDHYMALQGYEWTETLKRYTPSSSRPLNYKRDESKNDN